MTYRIPQMHASPYLICDVDRDLYQLGIEYQPTTAEYIESLPPLLKLLAEEIRNNPSNSTIDQVAHHLDIIAEQCTKMGQNEYNN